jgi:Zn-dependent M28 family amino/carboxypeptidase
MGAVQSFDLATKASFSGNFKQRIMIASNVAGLISGNDAVLNDEFLLIAAHYDHLGIGPPVAQDSIYNGVVDNAIGVAVALELSRVLKKSAHNLSRSILFLFVTGEENGLLGSRYYCEHPLIPLYRTIAALNIDGIGITDEFNSITGIGAELSNLETILQMVADQLGLRVEPVPKWIPETEPITSSDQFSFISAGIPSVLVMEGLDYRNLSDEIGLRRFIRWGQEIYHTPNDDLSQPINYNAVLQHMQVLFTFAHTVTNTYITPQWSPGSQFINVRLQTIAERR